MVDMVGDGDGEKDTVLAMAVDMEKDIIGRKSNLKNKAGKLWYPEAGGWNVFMVQAWE